MRGRLSTLSYSRQDIGGEFIYSSLHMTTLLTLLRTKESEGRTTELPLGVVSITVSDRCSFKKPRRLPPDSIECLGLQNGDVIEFTIGDKREGGSATLKTQILNQETIHQLYWGHDRLADYCVVYQGEESIEARLSVLGEEVPRGVNVTAYRTPFAPGWEGGE